MLARFLEQGRVGQILAPDPTYEQQSHPTSSSPTATEAETASSEGLAKKGDDNGDSSVGWWITNVVAPRDPSYEEKLKIRRRLRRKGSSSSCSNSSNHEALDEALTEARRRNGGGGVGDAKSGKQLESSSSSNRSTGGMASAAKGETKEISTTTSTSMVRCVHCNRFTPASNAGVGDDVDADADVGAKKKTMKKEEDARENSSSNANTTTTTTTSSSSTDDKDYVTPHSARRKSTNDGDNASALYRTGAASASASSNVATSTSNSNNDIVDQKIIISQVEHLTLLAAKSTAESLSSPTFVWESRSKVFAYCASKSALSVKKLTKLRRMLMKDQSLASCRSVSLGDMVPDGFTPLHACAYVGNVDAAKVLFSLNDDAVKEDGDGEEKKVATADDVAAAAIVVVDPDARDLQGRTPLHVAAEQGKIDMVRYLLQIMKKDEGDPPSSSSSSSENKTAAALLQTPSTKNNNTAAGDGVPATPASSTSVLPVGKDAPIDLTGRTPLGWAATSREPDARKHRTELERALFSPGDSSVCGSHTSLRSRAGGHGGSTLMSRSPVPSTTKRRSTQRRRRSTQRRRRRSVGSDDGGMGGGSGRSSSLPTTRVPRRLDEDMAGEGKTETTKEESTLDTTTTTTAAPTTVVEGTNNSNSETRTETTETSTVLTNERKYEKDDDEHAYEDKDDVPRLDDDDDDDDDVDDAETEMEEEEETVMPIVPLIRYGYAEMPGWRIAMEDAICALYPLLPFPPHYPYGCGDSDVVVDGDSDGDGALPLKKNRHRSPLGLFGVFDGHGDGGLASRYVADRLPIRLRDTEGWKTYRGPSFSSASSSASAADAGAGADAEEPIEDAGDGAKSSSSTSIRLLSSALDAACRDVDDDLRARSFAQDGGSTAIVALVSPDAIVVANVGDSRCILVQRKRENRTRRNGRDDDSSRAAAEEAEDGTKASGGESSGHPITERPTDEKVDDMDGQSSASIGSEEGIVVTALSEDHKPDLPNERERVERAGLFVLPEVFRDAAAAGDNLEGVDGRNGKDDGGEENNFTTIWKIQKSETEKIAVSRAFGDYDYKSNSDLPPDEQAVVCTPDIRIHDRDDQRDMFLILACDGIWDVMSNDEVGHFVTERVGDASASASSSSAEGPPLSDPLVVLPKVGDDLLNECLRRGSRDNMTVLIVALPGADLPSYGTGGCADKRNGVDASAVKPTLLFDVVDEE